VELVPLFLPKRTLKLIRGVAELGDQRTPGLVAERDLSARETEPEFPVQPSFPKLVIHQQGTTIKSHRTSH